MSKKAPDTRNKLDNNRQAKKSVLPRKKESLSLKELKDNVKEVSSPVKLKAEKKPSKGKLFKQAHGYSKTMKRNMRKKGVATVVEYRPFIKARKLAEKKVRQKKHSESVAYKRLNGKAKGKGKAQPVKKKEKKK